jgi:hypothetical protein
MNWGVALDRLELDDNTTIDKDVNTEFLGETQAVVQEPDVFFDLDKMTAPSQILRQQVAVHRLQQPWPQPSMQPHRCVDDVRRNKIDLRAHAPAPQ